MATIGLKDLYYSILTESAQGAATYATPINLAKAISGELAVESAEANLYADDALAQSIKMFKSGTLTLIIEDLTPTVVAALLGQTEADDKVVYSNSTDNAPYVAIGFKALRGDGTYRHVWLYKVKFAVPKESYATKGESIEFKTPELTGTFMARADGAWKCDFTGVETDPIAAAWFTAVKEKTVVGG